MAYRQYIFDSRIPKPYTICCIILSIKKLKIKKYLKVQLNLIYETEKELSVQGEKIDPLVKSEIEFTKTVLQQTIEQRLRPDEKLNIERIDTQMDSLLQIWQKLPTDFYEKYKLNQN